MERISFLVVAVLVGSSSAQAIDLAKYSERDLSDLSTLLGREGVATALDISLRQKKAMLDAVTMATEAITEEVKRKRTSSTIIELNDLMARMQLAQLDATLAQLTNEQCVRLEQLLLQYQIMWYGIPDMLPQVIPLTGSQQREFQSKHDDLSKEFRTKIWGLYRDAIHDLIGTLNPSQMAAWQAATGDPFEFKTRLSGMRPTLGLALSYEARFDTVSRELVLLLRREDVRHEIELLDEQFEEITRGGEKAELEREWFKLTQRADEAKGEESQAIREEATALFQRLTALIEKSRDETLLPHQKKRLEQLRVWSRAVVDPVGTIDEVVRLSGEQRGEMINKTNEWHDVLKQTMWNYHRRQQEELLDVLTPEQRQQWSRRFGNEFIFQGSHGFHILRYFR